MSSGIRELPKWFLHDEYSLSAVTLGIYLGGRDLPLFSSPPHSRKTVRSKMSAMLYVLRMFCVQGKWAERNYKLCDRYIPYALGGGYILGSGIIR